jgi:hypothetical protein
VAATSGGESERALICEEEPNGRRNGVRDSVRTRWGTRTCNAMHHFSRREKERSDSRARPRVIVVSVCVLGGRVGGEGGKKKGSGGCGWVGEGEGARRDQRPPLGALARLFAYVAAATFASAL